MGPYGYFATVQEAAVLVGDILKHNAPVISSLISCRCWASVPFQTPERRVFLLPVSCGLEGLPQKS